MKIHKQSSGAASASHVRLVQTFQKLIRLLMKKMYCFGSDKIRFCKVFIPRDIKPSVICIWGLFKGWWLCVFFWFGWFLWGWGWSCTCEDCTERKCIQNLLLKASILLSILRHSKTSTGSKNTYIHKHFMWARGWKYHSINPDEICMPTQVVPQQHWKKRKKNVLLQVLFHITSETMQALVLIWFWEKTVPIWIIPWQPNYKILAASQSQSTG